MWRRWTRFPRPTLCPTRSGPRRHRHDPYAAPTVSGLARRRIIGYRRRGWSKYRRQRRRGPGRRRRGRQRRGQGLHALAKSSGSIQPFAEPSLERWTSFRGRNPHDRQRFRNLSSLPIVFCGPEQHTVWKYTMALISCKTCPADPTQGRGAGDKKREQGRRDGRGRRGRSGRGRAASRPGALRERVEVGAVAQPLSKIGPAGRRVCEQVLQSNHIQFLLCTTASLHSGAVRRALQLFMLPGDEAEVEARNSPYWTIYGGVHLSCFRQSF